MDREEKLKVLEELGGISEEVYDELCAGGVKDIKDKYAELGPALKNGEMNIAKDAAHAIKGISGNYRIREVHEISKKLDKAIKDKESDDIIMNYISELKEAIERL